MNKNTASGDLLTQRVCLDFLKNNFIDIPVGITYYIDSGTVLTGSIIIKGTYTDGENQNLVLANGSMIPLMNVLDIFKHPDIKHECNYYFGHEVRKMAHTTE